MPLYQQPLDLGVLTYANLPPASAAYSGYRARASDIGIAPGMMLVCDGARWKPDGVQVLAQGTVGMYQAPTGTMANNGAVTLGTALPQTFAQGLYLHFPASAIVSGSAAGWYWTVMSSTTVGQVFNNTYTSGTPAAPGSNTPFVTTGPGAFTGETSEVDHVTISVPANLMGINGGFEEADFWTTTSSVNNKTHKIKLAGNNVGALIIASNPGIATRRSVMNDNSAARQISQNNTWGLSGANAVNWTTVDTTSAQNIAIAGTKVTATEIIGLDRWIIYALP